MKIASALQRTSVDFETRKRALVRKEMDQAYKKQAKFAEASKNPLLVAMENLLSGKTEKEIHEQQFEDSRHVAEEQLTREEKLQLPEVQREIKDLLQTEKEVIAHEQAHKAVGAGVTGPITYEHTTGPDDQQYIAGGEVSIQAPPTTEPEETLNVLEKVRQAALAPANPSPQDLRVAASAAAQIQAVRGEMASERVDELEEEPFTNESFEVEIPERFTAAIERNAEKETVFGQNLEQQLFTRTFNKAKVIYTSHIEMVKNSYRSYNEPKFSITA